MRAAFYRGVMQEEHGECPETRGYVCACLGGEWWWCRRLKAHACRSKRAPITQLANSVLPDTSGQVPDVCATRPTLMARVNQPCCTEKMPGAQSSRTFMTSIGESLARAALSDAARESDSQRRSVTGADNDSRLFTCIAKRGNTLHIASFRTLL